MSSMLRLKRNEHRGADVGPSSPSRGFAIMPRLFGKKKTPKQKAVVVEAAVDDSGVASSVASSDDAHARSAASTVEVEGDDVLQKRLEVQPTTSSEFRFVVVSTQSEHVRAHSRAARHVSTLPRRHARTSSSMPVHLHVCMYVCVPACLRACVPACLLLLHFPIAVAVATD